MKRGLFLGLLLLAGLWPAAAPRAEGNVEAGRKFAATHCSRCHVVGEENKYGGIGSTPSFPLLVTLRDYRERFQSFYERRPHPVFARMANVDKWVDLPSPVVEFDVTAADIDNIMAFIETLRKE